MIAANRRRAELAKIHLAATQLGMDTADKDLNSEYRAMLFSIAGERSAAKLTDKGRQEVLEHLRNCGFKAQPRKRVAEHPGKPHNLNREAMLQKIEAYLADMKLPWSYVDAIAKQQTGIARVAWLRKYEDLKAIVAALHVEQEKRGMLASLDEALAERGITREQMAERFKLRRNWERHRPTLRGLLERVCMTENQGSEQWKS